jgi:hypothetical protein
MEVWKVDRFFSKTTVSMKHANQRKGSGFQNSTVKTTGLPMPILMDLFDVNSF